MNEYQRVAAGFLVGVGWVVAGLGVALGIGMPPTDVGGSPGPFGAIVATIGLVIVISSIRAWRRLPRD